MIINIGLIDEWIILFATFYCLEFKTWCLIVEIEGVGNEL